MHGPSRKSRWPIRAEPSHEPRRRPPRARVAAGRRRRLRDGWAAEAGPDRRKPTPDVGAEPLSGAAQLGRIELGEIDPKPAEDARAEEAERKADGEHEPGVAERQHDVSPGRERAAEREQRHAAAPA